MLFGEWILPFPVFSMVYTSLSIIKGVRILQSMRWFLVLLSISTINKILLFDKQLLDVSWFMTRWNTIHSRSCRTADGAGECRPFTKQTWTRGSDQLVAECGGASNSASLTRYKTQTSRILTHCVESIQVDERDHAVGVDLIWLLYMALRSAQQNKAIFVPNATHTSLGVATCRRDLSVIWQPGLGYGANHLPRPHAGFNRRKIKIHLWVTDDNRISVAPPSITGDGWYMALALQFYPRGSPIPFQTSGFLLILYEIAALHRELVFCWYSPSAKQ